MKTTMLTTMLILWIAPAITIGQVVDDVYFKPSDGFKVEAGNEKTEVKAKPNYKNGAKEIVYLKRDSNETILVEGDSIQVFASSSDTTWTDEENGSYINGFNGSQSDLEYAERIRKFHNPKYTIHISDPRYNDIYFLNNSDWNVYVDDNYAWVTPTWTNPYWNDYYYRPFSYNSWYWRGGYSPYYGYYDPYWGGMYNNWYGGWGGMYGGYYGGMYGGYYGGWYGYGGYWDYGYPYYNNYWGYYPYGGGYYSLREPRNEKHSEAYRRKYNENSIESLSRGATRISGGYGASSVRYSVSGDNENNAEKSVYGNGSRSVRNTAKGIDGNTTVTRTGYMRNSNNRSSYNATVDGTTRGSSSVSPGSVTRSYNSDNVINTRTRTTVRNESSTTSGNQISSGVRSTGTVRNTNNTESSYRSSTSSGSSTYVNRSSNSYSNSGSRSSYSTSGSGSTPSYSNSSSSSGSYSSGSSSSGSSSSYSSGSSSSGGASRSSSGGGSRR